MELEVILAADAPVGPHGGMRKADETVKLDAVTATELVYQGKARWPEGKEPRLPAAEPTETRSSGSSGSSSSKSRSGGSSRSKSRGNSAGGSQPPTTAPAQDNGTGEVPVDMKQTGE